MTARQPISRFELLASRVELVLPIVVLLVAIFLRQFRLDNIPSGRLWDEAHNGFDALRILEGERPIFLVGNFDREALFVYLQALGSVVLGQTVLALRIASAVIGILAILSGKHPTSVWDAGETIADLRTLSIPPDLPAGGYRLAIGLYDPDSGQRLQIVDPNEKASGDYVTISGLIVEAK